MFDKNHESYEAWFDSHSTAYISELLALRPFVPLDGLGLEIGVGSGRFAAPLGVRVGIDPSRKMLEYAAARGVETLTAKAENLPFEDDTFDYALIVTTICFVDSPSEMLSEAGRVIKPGGHAVVGFIDRESPLGQEYLKHKEESVFYRDATFYSTSEVETLLKENGFEVSSRAQTLTGLLPEIEAIEPTKSGSGESAFIVIAATNKK